MESIYSYLLNLIMTCLESHLAMGVLNQCLTLWMGGVPQAAGLAHPLWVRLCRLISAAISESLGHGVVTQCSDDNIVQYVMEITVQYLLTTSTSGFVSATTLDGTT